MWTVPPHKMKGGREHRVPLPKRAVEILQERRGDTSPQSDALVWGLSRAALSKMLALLARTETVHGMRSAFKDWATDFAPSRADIIASAMRGEIIEAFPRDMTEVALAHSLDSKTQEAYRRTDMIERRRRMMELWSKFLASAD